MFSSKKSLLRKLGCKKADLSRPPFTMPHKKQDMNDRKLDGKEKALNILLKKYNSQDQVSTSLKMGVKNGDLNTIHGSYGMVGTEQKSSTSVNYRNVPSTQTQKRSLTSNERNVTSTLPQKSSIAPSQRNVTSNFPQKGSLVSNYKSTTNTLPQKRLAASNQRNSTSTLPKKISMFPSQKGLTATFPQRNSFSSSQRVVSNTFDNPAKKQKLETMQYNKLFSREVPSSIDKPDPKNPLCSPKTFICKFCCRRFFSFETLQEHAVTHGNEPKHICYVCKHQAGTFSALMTHYLRHPEAKSSMMEINSPKIKTEIFHEKFSSASCPKTSIRCIHCKISFSTKERFNAHHCTGIEKKQEYNCAYCGKVSKSVTEYRDHVQSHSQTPFVCTLCGSKFQQKKSLDRHADICPKMRRQNKMSLKCEKCSTQFQKRFEFNKHVVVCNKSSSVALKVSCTICNVKFETDLELSKHVETCEKSGKVILKVFSCPTCSSKFRKESEYKKHVATCEKPTSVEIKTFTCLSCSAKFEKQTEFKKHVKICSKANSTAEKELSPSTELQNEMDFSENIENEKKITNTNIIKELSCTSCSAKFEKQLEMDKHLEFCEKSACVTERLTCSLCTANFENHVEFSAHEKTCSKLVSEKDLSCSSTNVQSETDSYSDEQESSHNEASEESSKLIIDELFCTLCSARFKTQVEFSRHVEVCGKSTKIIIRKLSCPSCSAKFLNQFEFNTHVEKCNKSADTCLLKETPSSKNSIVLNEDAEMSEQLTESTKKLFCSLCNEKFTEQAEYESHVKSCKITEVIESVVVPPVKGFMCSSCGSIFDSRFNFDIHSQFCITSEKLAETQYFDSLTPQRRSTRLGIKKYSSPEETKTRRRRRLPFKYKTEESIKITKPKGRKPKRLLSLTKNISSVTENLLPPTENFSFPSEDLPSPTKNISSPVKIASSPVKDVLSPTKSISSPTKRVLSSPKNTSSPTKHVLSSPKNNSSPTKNVKIKTKKAENIATLLCNICNFSFCSKSSLIRHKRMHSGNPWFTCKFCGKFFFRKDVYIRHEMNVHNKSSKEMLCCCYCRLFFNTSPALKEHVMTAHKEKAFLPNRSKVPKNFIHNEAKFFPIKQEAFDNSESKESELTVSSLATLSNMDSDKTSNTSSKSFNCGLCLLPHKHMDDLKQHFIDFHDTPSTEVENLKNENTIVDSGASENTVRDLTVNHKASEILNMSSVLEVPSQSHVNIRSMVINTTEEATHTDNSGAGLEENTEMFIDTAFEASPASLQNSLLCKLCTKSFPSESLLEVHEDTDHKVVDWYQCLVCDSGGPKEDMITHMFNHMYKVGTFIVNNTKHSFDTVLPFLPQFKNLRTSNHETTGLCNDDVNSSEDIYHLMPPLRDMNQSVISNNVYENIQQNNLSRENTAIDQPSTNCEANIDPCNSFEPLALSVNNIKYKNCSEVKTEADINNDLDTSNQNTNICNTTPLPATGASTEEVCCALSQSISSTPEISISDSVKLEMDGHINPVKDSYSQQITSPHNSSNLMLVEEDFQNEAQQLKLNPENLSVNSVKFEDLTPSDFSLDNLPPQSHNICNVHSIAPTRPEIQSSTSSQSLTLSAENLHNSSNQFTNNGLCNDLSQSSSLYNLSALTSAAKKVILSKSFFSNSGNLSGDSVKANIDINSGTSGDMQSQQNLNICDLSVTSRPTLIEKISYAPSQPLVSNSEIPSDSSSLKLESFANNELFACDPFDQGTSIYKPFSAGIEGDKINPVLMEPLNLSTEAPRDSFVEAKDSSNSDSCCNALNLVINKTEQSRTSPLNTNISVANILQCLSQEADLYSSFSNAPEYLAQMDPCLNTTEVSVPVIGRDNSDSGYACSSIINDIQCKHCHVVYRGSDRFAKHSCVQTAFTSEQSQTSSLSDRTKAFQNHQLLRSLLMSNESLIVPSTNTENLNSFLSNSSGETSAPNSTFENAQW